MENLGPKHPKRAQALPGGSPSHHTLYISGEHITNHPHELEKLKIGAVCSLSQDPFTLPQHIQHLHLEVPDHPEANIRQHLEPAFQFIEQNIKRSNVLVHCVGGVSRSAAVCVYYLMRKHRWSMEVSLCRLRECRPWVRPNEGFMGQLREEQKRLGLRSELGRF